MSYEPMARRVPSEHQSSDVKSPCSGLAEWSNITGGKEGGVTPSVPSQPGEFCSGTFHRLTTASFDLNNVITLAHYTTLLLGSQMNTPWLTICNVLDSMRKRKPESLMFVEYI